MSDAGIGFEFDSEMYTGPDARQQLRTLHDELRRMVKISLVAKFMFPFIIAVWVVLELSTFADLVPLWPPADLVRELQRGEWLETIGWELFLIPLIAGLVVITGWLVVYFLVCLYRLGLPERLRRARIIERFLAWPRELPNLDSYTTYPMWTISSFLRIHHYKSARQLAWNVDWYLLPEPRNHFRYGWVFLDVCLGSQILYNAFNIFPKHWAPHVAQRVDDIWFLLIMTFFLILTPLFIYEMLRQRACAQALLREVERRLEAAREEPGEPSPVLA